MRKLTAFAFAILVMTPLLLTAEEYRGPKTDEYETGAGPLLVTPIYHGSLMFEWNGVVVHIDPWSQGDYADKPAADIILFTHEHQDHVDLPLIEKLLKPDTKLFLTAAVASIITGHEWKAGEAPAYTVMANGDVLEAAGIGIKAVPAYNIVRERAPGQKFHPKGQGNGYVFDFGGKIVYVAGDSEFIPEMKEMGKVDIAFLPCNLPYTMSLEEVAEAARAIKPAVFYPYHCRGTEVEKLPEMLADVEGLTVKLVELY